jgi:hypothetical protein
MSRTCDSCEADKGSGFRDGTPSRGWGTSGVSAAIVAIELRDSLLQQYECERALDDKMAGFVLLREDLDAVGFRTIEGPVDSEA